MTKLREHLSSTEPEILRDVILRLLEPNLFPAFATLPKRENDLLLLDVLIKIGFISVSPTLYELVCTLKITRARASALLYERELRIRSSGDLDALVKDALLRPILQKQGEMIGLEVENALVADHLREKLRQLNFATDGSFSRTLVRISFDAAAALYEEFIDEKQRKAVRAAFVKAGAPDKTLKGILKGLLQKLASKAADKAGEEAAGSAFDNFAPLLSGKVTEIGIWIKGLFAESQQEN